jgi:hypothetical protein
MIKKVIATSLFLLLTVGIFGVTAALTSADPWTVINENEAISAEPMSMSQGTVVNTATGLSPGQPIDLYEQITNNGIAGALTVSIPTFSGSGAIATTGNVLVAPWIDTAYTTGSTKTAPGVNDIILLPTGAFHVIVKDDTTNGLYLDSNGKIIPGQYTQLSTTNVWYSAPLAANSVNALHFSTMLSPTASATLAGATASFGTIAKLSSK